MTEGPDLSRVTRVQLQTELGRYEFWADSWRPELKDDGNTLYLRGRGEGTYAKQLGQESQ
jgi:hypothetical protein